MFMLLVYIENVKRASMVTIPGISSTELMSKILIELQNRDKQKDANSFDRYCHHHNISIQIKKELFKIRVICSS